jgi:hypothetical protein
MKMKTLQAILSVLLFAQFVAVLSPHTLNEKILHAVLFGILSIVIIAIYKRNKK